jgi:hypothetical protein
VARGNRERRPQRVQDCKHKTTTTAGQPKALLPQQSRQRKSITFTNAHTIEDKCCLLMSAVFMYSASFASGKLKMGCCTRRKHAKTSMLEHIYAYCEGKLARARCRWRQHKTNETIQRPASNRPNTSEPRYRTPSAFSPDENVPLNFENQRPSKT